MHGRNVSSEVVVFCKSPQAVLFRALNAGQQIHIRNVRAGNYLPQILPFVRRLVHFQMLRCPKPLQATFLWALERAIGIG